MRWQMWKQKAASELRRLMQGRYGADQLAVVLLFLALLFSVVARFSGLAWLELFYYAGIAYALWRIFSRNYVARSRENQKLLAVVSQGKAGVLRLRNRWRDRKDYRYISCPSCGQHLRLPRGKGKIEVTCIRCRSTFIRKV